VLAIIVAEVFQNFHDHFDPGLQVPSSRVGGCVLARRRQGPPEHMNQAVFAFRRYEDASLRYTGIESHERLTHYGLYDTVVARE